MQLSIAKDIFGSPWHIDAMGLQQYRPVVTGMLNGAVIAEEKEPSENIPFAVSAKTLIPLDWSTAEDDIEDDGEPKREKVVHVLPVRGVMMKHDMACGPRGTRTLANRLKQADADPAVIAHIMIFEGPGGAANAVPELSDAMKACKKRILGFVDGIAASAHQYVLSFCDEKWASRETDIVGSIGTMMMYNGRKSKSDENLFKDIEVTIYADDAFEKNEEYEKAINDFDFTLTKSRILNPHNKKFQEDIKANYNNKVEDKHLHGRTFQAIEVVGSLIDKIGTFEDAVKRVIELSNLNLEEKESQNKIKMEQFTHVNAALGVESLESVDDVVSLNAEQMQTLDTALGNADQVAAERDAAVQERDAATGERDTAVAERDTAAQERDTAAQERDTAREELTNALGAFDAIDATVAAAETPEAKAEAVRALLASKPGAKIEGNHDEEDPKGGSATDADWDAINELPHNKAVDENS